MVDFAGLFGAALSGMYENATLHRKTDVAYSDGGRITAPTTSSYLCKAQIQSMTERMRQAQGYSDTDQRIFVLASTLEVVPSTDDEITVNGIRWGIGSVDQDPGRAYWELRGVRRG